MRANRDGTHSERYPRDWAVRVLTRVLSTGDTLEVALSDSPVSARAWLQEVCAGTLRWKGRLDLAIDSLAEKKKPTGALRKHLLLGAYQLIGQERTDPVSVVVETVDAVKAAEGEAPAKFANAVLRRLSERAAEWRSLPFSPRATDESKAAWASLPLWMWRGFSRGYTEARAARIAEAMLARPTIWLQSDGIAPDAEAGLAEGPWPGALAWAPAGRAITELPGWSEGKLFVQDLSSQRMAADAADAITQAGLQGPVLDLCAAPGGKSVALAWRGLSVVSTDRPVNEGQLHERFRLLEENASRLGRGRMRVVARDAIPAEPWSLVWVDAPCTGSGILRRHPEARWLKTEKELASLRELQKKLLHEAAERVPPGSFLLYSVCSLLPEEGKLHFEGGKALQGFERVRDWVLTPEEAPSGDGFWGVLLRKPRATG